MSLLVIPSPSESIFTSASHEYPRDSDSRSTANASNVMVSSVNLVISTMALFTEGGVASYTVRLEVELDVMPLASVTSILIVWVPA